jgi:hypothetical protein
MARELVINIKALGPQAKAELASVERSIDGVSAKSKKVDTDLEKVSATLSKVSASATRIGAMLSAAVTLPILAVGAASIKMAMDAVESENLFAVSFGNMADAARDWSVTTSEALGLNQYELRRTSATLFTMFDSMGIAKEGAFEMSTSMTTLAYDMASFYNLPHEAAFEKLRAGISGEAEPLKQLGILVDEATVKTAAYRAGIAKQGEELSQQQKVLGRYAAIMEQTSKAQGDLARTIDSPTNQLRVMRERLNETAVALGMQLLPYVTQAIGLLLRLAQGAQTAVQWFGALPRPIQATVLVVTGLVAAVGPLLLIFGTMAGALSSLITLYATFGGAQVATTATTVAQATATGVLSGSLRVLLGVLGPIAIAIGAVWAAWQVGNIESVKNKIAEWTLRLQGMNAEQAKAAVTATAAAAATRTQAAATTPATVAIRDSEGAMKAAALAAQQESAALGKNSDATKKAAASAKELTDWKEKQATAYRALQNEAGEREIEQVAKAEEARKALAELDRVALDDMRQLERDQAALRLKDADAAAELYLARELDDYREREAAAASQRD